MKKNKGFAGMNFDQILMHQTQRAVEQPVYCRLCGFDVKTPSSKSPGGSNGDWRRHLDWEIANQAHATCTNEYFSGRK